MRRLGKSIVSFTLVLTTAAPAIAQERVNPMGAAIKEFLDRTKGYVELQKKEDDGLPSESPRKARSVMEVRHRALAARMRLARPNAKPGDIFGSADTCIRELIVKDAQSRAPKDKKAAMEEVPPQNPPKIN